MTKQKLHEIKHNIRINIPSLRYADFKIWKSGEDIKLQCYKLSLQGKAEFYGHIYKTENINKGILSITN